MINVNLFVFNIMQIVNRDETFEEPPVDQPPPPPPAPPAKPVSKYHVKQPKTLVSRYEQIMLQREADYKSKVAREKEEAEQRERDEIERPGVDELHGRRIHAWVLIKAGKRDVPRDFFIEPFTGTGMELNTSKLLGVEAVFNNHNFWATVHEASFDQVNWNLRDRDGWEPLVAMGNNQMKTMNHKNDVILEEDEDDNESGIEPDLPHKLPPSWCSEIKISHADFESRAPEGKRTKVYKRAIFEHFSPYVQSDGLVLRKTFYKDLKCASTLREDLTYENREDMQTNRKVNLVDRVIEENFCTGREDCLKRHSCTIHEEKKPETDRTFDFYGDNRADGLYKLVETHTSIVEHFKGLSHISESYHPLS